MTSRLLFLSLVTLALAGCGGKDGSATMLPGHDCLRCHSSGGKASNKPFTAAGTVFSSPTATSSGGVAGAQVSLVDATGKQTLLTTNSVGNFYTMESLTFPLHATVTYGGKTQTMTDPVTAGGCSGCHSQPPQNGAPGRTYVLP